MANFQPLINVVAALRTRVSVKRELDFPNHKDWYLGIFLSTGSLIGRHLISGTAVFIVSSRMTTRINLRNAKVLRHRALSLLLGYVTHSVSSSECSSGLDNKTKELERVIYLGIFIIIII